MQIKKLLFSFVLMVFACVLTIDAQSTMTDQQVLDYGKTAIKAGKDEKTIAKELVARGVTREQAERVKKLYESESNEKISTDVSKDIQRVHVINEEAESQDQILAPEYTKDTRVVEKSDSIFGRNIFNNKSLNFAPSANMATPLNYTLGPGDEVIIDIFGANQTTLRQTISPEGSINVDILGPLYLNGMTITEANTFLKKKLSSIYAGLNQKGSTDIRLSLGQIRTIQINIVGEVANPGTYTISSLATLYHALYRAGGVVGNGTLRNIIVSRNGRTAGELDIYEFLMTGTRKNDIRLQEGDVILVKPLSILVNVKGKVKRPMHFELKEGESLQTLIDYAGGFAQGAYTKTITVIRQNGRQYEVCSVDEFNFVTFKLQNGDEVEVGDLLSRFENRVMVEGSIYKPGLYQLNEVNTVKTLISKADGVLPEAFLSRAVLHRERKDLSLEVLSVDLKGILDGTTPDIPLRNNDVLYVPSIYEIQEAGTVTISGEVVRPGTFPYADNTTIEDLVIQAGGLKNTASLARVDVLRRAMDNKALTSGKTLAERFSFSMKEGFVVDGEPGFTLKPYDVVIIYRSPGYEEQQYVTVKGETNFTGTFALSNKGMRLSDLIKVAGGATDMAYIKGARLERQKTQTEIENQRELVQSLQTFGGKDSIDTKTLNYSNKYYVGINLEKALAEPGGQYDVILREGDVLEIPVYNNVVRVTGAVASSNAVTYEKGKTLKWYIENAGGYTENARKKHVYAVDMNGHISRLKRNSKVEPGSEIIVPQKQKKQSNLANTLGIATTSASIATMLGTLYNIIK